MKIYLVDFENVKSKGLEDIDKLEETDNVIIFYSENSDTISFEMHQKVLTSKAEVEYFKVNVGGKNALDFQLSTLLGYLVAKNQYSHIFIISNDRGFEFLHDFWNGNYVDAPETIVYRTKTISDAIKFTKVTKPEVKKEVAPKKVVEKIEETVSEKEVIPVQQEEKVEDVAKPTNVQVNEEKTPRKKTIRVKANMSFDEMLSILLNGKCAENDFTSIRGLILASATKEEFHNLLAKTYKQQGTDYYKALKSNYLRLKNQQEKEMPAEEKPEVSAETDIKTENTEEIAVPQTNEQADENKATEDITAIENVQTEETSSPVHDRINELLCGICGGDEIVRICKCFDGSKTKKQFYLRMIKEFRKEKGCEYYNAIRSEYLSLIRKVQNV